MRVLVTGAAGFIGSHLVDRLLGEGEEVLGIDNLSSGTLANLSDARRTPMGKFTFQRVDITSTAIADLIERNKPDVIFHLAAQVDVRKSVADPLHDAMVNVIGTLNILHAATKAKTRKVVFTSSGGCIYGEPGEERLPVSEDQVYLPESMPESPYGVSKKIVLDYLRYFAAVKDLDYTALALSNVFGPRQEPASEVGLEGQVVAIFSRKMLAGRPCTIYGDGTQTRDFVYVDDVVSAFMAAREKGSRELINIGSGSELSVNELYAALAELTGSRFEPIYAAARPGELQRIVVDPRKAGEVLGWSQSVPLGDGLKQTVAYFKANPVTTK
ncbi:MAG TPA: NAD-dependent epimerase/dehydratase family protein [Actinomycetota bacterium]|nr:NAD-dependent epimerase/dehydratase family protein [Actinomycetota bacterium]